MHLAATLKKLLTILLLMVLVGQTPGYFYAKTHETSFVKETKEKAVKGGEEKSETEYITHPFTGIPQHPKKIAFGLYRSAPGLSPLQDCLTPPPDVQL